MKLLLYGAGSVGRGFIGPLFSQAGYEVVFVDIDPILVRLINEKREYSLTIVSDPPDLQTVRGIRAVDGSDPEAVAAEIEGADILATALGASALRSVAPILARGLARRMEAGRPPVNILLCENLMDAADLLRGWIGEYQSARERRWMEDHVGLVSTAIGRMIPAANPKRDGLHLSAEPYAFLPVDRDVFLGPLPPVAGLVPHSPFRYYEERKLYLHNMGHAMCAYLGRMAGHTYIWEAVEDLPIRLAVLCAMTESASMLSAKYRVSFAPLWDHILSLLDRFGNRALADTCERVARDPLRKIRANDRFAGAIRSCLRHSLYPVHIALGLAAAASFLPEDGPPLDRTLQEVCELPEDLSELVEGMAEALARHPVHQVLRRAVAVKLERIGLIV